MVVALVVDLVERTDAWSVVWMVLHLVALMVGWSVVGTVDSLESWLVDVLVEKKGAL